MAKQGPNKHFRAVEVLELLERDAGSTVCVSDSSSEDEDLVHPDNTQDSSDSDYLSGKG